MKQSKFGSSQIPFEQLEKIRDRYLYLQEELILTQDTDTLIQLSKELNGLKSIVEKIDLYNEITLELEELEELINDPELKSVAMEEQKELTQKLQKTENELLLELIPKDVDDEKSVVLEIRAGTGGDEAALFCGVLYRMYERYAEAKEWKFEPLDSSESTVGGFKEITVTIEGKGVFARLKYESGVHRVQRVPQTEASGRIHTSAATVAVLPEAEEVDLVIAPEDIRIDTMRASGAGGQHVNKTDSAVRITHIPTGIAVVSAEKSQHVNRVKAMNVLRSRLINLQTEKLKGERAANRKSQVGSGDRSERIRTYNFPQGRVTDHRINLTSYGLEKILEGELDEFVDALITNQQTQELAKITQ